MNNPTQMPVTLAPAPMDGVFPEGFYVTSNLPTQILVGDQWLPVQPEMMDAGICYKEGKALTLKMGDVQAGDLFVIGREGVREAELPQPEKKRFGFMNSEVSMEKPTHLIVNRLAERLQQLRHQKGSILFVGGPAIVHTGARALLARLIREGYVHVLFAGNALAAHDLEAALVGTSLGVDLKDGKIKVAGNENHLRTINKIRALGSMEKAVEIGLVREGIVYEMIQNKIPYVLAGSIRDDGPLPGVITDTREAQRAMKHHLQGVQLSMMVCTLLHSIATSNLMAGRVETYAVDLSTAAVTKMKDRGNHQSMGLVMSAEAFLYELCRALDLEV